MQHPPSPPLSIDQVMERWMCALRQAAQAEQIAPDELEQEWRWVCQRAAQMRHADAHRRQRALETARRYWPEYLPPLDSPAPGAGR